MRVSDKASGPQTPVEWRAQHGMSSEHVGFYGCHVLDRVVRVGTKDEIEDSRRLPRHAELLCPCGNLHAVGITWRWVRLHEPVEAEVLV